HLLQAALDPVDDRLDLLGGDGSLLAGELDAGDHLLPIEVLAAAVLLHHHGQDLLDPLVGGEAALAAEAFAPPPDHRALVGEARRRPLVSNGFSGSPGIMFLLVVIPALPSAVSATLPVSFLGRRSQSMRCVSVPPATRRSPPSSSPCASACALSRMRC